MKQIQKISLQQLPNDEHFQFQTDIKALIDVTTTSALRIIPLYDAYQSAYTAEQVALRTEQANPLTKTIQADDTYRNMLNRGFYLFVEAKTMHYNAEVQAAAERIKVILDHYGNLGKQNYNKETSNILSRDQEITANCFAELTTIEGSDWLNKIDTASNCFLTDYG
jgi:hypothetical protein